MGVLRYNTLSLCGHFCSVCLRSWTSDLGTSNCTPWLRGFIIIMIAMHLVFLKYIYKSSKTLWPYLPHHKGSNPWSKSRGFNKFGRGHYAFSFPRMCESREELYENITTFCILEPYGVVNTIKIYHFLEILQIKNL